ncbi:hypothetical protein A4V08_23275 [Lachnoclostridium sp. YL32]|nr:hypothetical protein A4V08_23275 [Lachnoclostridium sp. YL32]
MPSDGGCEKSPLTKKNIFRFYPGTFFFCWYNLSVMKNNTMSYYSPKQGRFPVFLADSLDICDPVLVFDQIMEEIGIEQYLRPEPLYRYGRPGYNRVNREATSQARNTPVYSRRPAA